MPSDDGQPRTARGRRESEATDHSLPTLVVAVQQVDRHRLCRGRGVAGDREDRIVRIAKRTLPEPRVTGGNIDVSGHAPKIADVGRFTGPDALRVEVPAAEYRDASSGVAKADHQVDRLRAHFEGSVAAFDGHPVEVVERHLLGRILET